jgi:hypothetical protein
VNEDYWTLNMTKASIGNKTIDTTTKTLIIDTGTSFFLMPNDDFLDLVDDFNQKYICGTSS